MNELQLDFLIKALVDGVVDTKVLATRSGIDAAELTPLEAELERGIALIQGLRKFACENMKPAGLPPPPNIYLNREATIDAQSPEYYAFEAVQRGNMKPEKCLFTCVQLGLDPAAAKTAIDNVCMPWREANGWRSYVQLDANERFILMDKAPVKIKKPLENLRRRLAAGSPSA